MNRIELPNDKELARKLITAQTELEAKRADMGKVGVLLGSKDNASIYLAAFVILVAVAGGTILAVYEPALRPDLGKAFIALALMAAGYMFGAVRRDGK
jgi:hypothetical protein